MLNRYIAKKFFSLIVVFLFFILLIPIKSSELSDNNEIIKKNYLLHEPIHIERNGDFILEGFPGSGSRDDPYRIENYNITSTTESCGINISATSRYFVIQNCYIDSVDYGIWISWVSYGTVSLINNTISNHKIKALNLWDASAAKVINNTLSFNEDGFSISNSIDIIVNRNNCSNNNNKGISIRYGDNITLKDNFCAQNDFGIDLVFSRNIVLSNNVCQNNRRYGIKSSNTFDAMITSNTLMNNDDFGFYISDSENLEIRTNLISYNSKGLFAVELSKSDIYNNTIDLNNERGISFHSSNYNFITFNRIRMNTEYGIHFILSTSNIIHHNNFINNNLGGVSQAFSSTSANNTWYEVINLEGNFWSELDLAEYYQIEGSDNSQDLYPLDEPVLTPHPSVSIEQNPHLILWVIIPPLLYLLVASLFLFSLNIEVWKRIKYKSVKETLDYIEKKRNIAFSDNVGTALFRFGKEGGNIVIEDLRSLELSLELFIGYCYATVGLGQRYEIGVFGPLPTPSLQKHNVIIFAFWGLDDEPSDPRLEGKQYYLVAVIYPESQNKNIIRINTMNDKFRNYVKKFKYPNRMTIEDLNHFREIVFV